MSVRYCFHARGGLASEADTPDNPNGFADQDAEALQAPCPTVLRVRFAPNMDQDYRAKRAACAYALTVCSRMSRRAPLKCQSGASLRRLCTPSAIGGHRSGNGCSVSMLTAGTRTPVPFPEHMDLFGRAGRHHPTPPLPEALEGQRGVVIGIGGKPLLLEPFVTQRCSSPLSLTNRSSVARRGGCCRTAPRRRTD
jgi:hypothetical protein